MRLQSARRGTTRGFRSLDDVLTGVSSRRFRYPFVGPKFATEPLLRSWARLTLGITSVFTTGSRGLGLPVHHSQDRIQSRLWHLLRLRESAGNGGRGQPSHCPRRTARKCFYQLLRGLAGSIRGRTENFHNSVDINGRAGIPQDHPRTQARYVPHLGRSLEKPPGLA